MGKVLVVDDEAAIRRLMFELLNDEFEVRFASCGSEAVKVSGEFKPDIILLDNSLTQEMSGIDALPYLKDKTPESFIIMLTGSADQNFMDKALASGASDCITKPFDIFKLKTKLEDIISRKTAC